MKNLTSSRIIPKKSTPIFLKLGMRLQNGGIHFQISDFLNGQVVLTNLITQEKRLTDDYTLIQKIQSGEIVEHQSEIDINSELGDLPPALKTEIDASIYSESAIRDFIWKFKLVRALEAEGVSRISNQPWIRAELQKIRSHKNLLGVKSFQISTLARFQRLLNACGGDYSKVIPKYSNRGGRGCSRLGSECDLLIDATIRQQLDSGQRIIKQHLIDKVNTQTQQLFLNGQCAKVPSNSSISRRIDRQISAINILSSRNGRRAAEKYFRGDGPRITAERALEVAEWDDVDSGLFLVDEIIGLPYGRGYITHGVDQCTLVPLGYDLSPFHRSTTSAINALTSSLVPKNMQAPAFQGTSCDWIGYGLAGVNLFDNALYNHADDLVNVQLNIKQCVDWVEPYHGPGKSAIEHFNHRLKNSFVCRLDGWKGDHDHPDYSKAGISGAIYDKATFERHYVNWVCNEYLNQPGDDGYTPAQRWHRFFSSQKPPVQWTREQIDFMRMRPKCLTPRDSDGLLHLSLRYQSDALRLLIKHVGKKAKIVVYESDEHLEYIVVQHPITKTIFKVPCVEDPRYINRLTPRHQRLILKQARLKKKTNPSLADCVAARDALVSQTEILRRDKRLRIRKKGYISAVPDMASAKQPSDAENRIRSKQPEILMTDLEYAVQDLDAIDVSDLDWGADV